ncbi:hypothetical protein Tco_0038097 [Tanacetum coccineum]
MRVLNISYCNKILALSLQGFSSTLASLKAAYYAIDSTGVSGILSGGGLEYLNLKGLKSRGIRLATIEVCVSDSRNVDLVINVPVRNRVPDTSLLTFSRSIYEFSELFCLPALSDVGIGRCPITTDFESERKFKLGLAERVALKDTKGMMDHATRGEQKQKEEELRMRKVALSISKDVNNIPCEDYDTEDYDEAQDDGM